MKMQWFVMAILAAFAIPIAQAQRAGGEGSGKLARVTPADAAPPESQVDPRQERKRFEPEAWKKRLLAGDLQARESAFEQILERARTDPTAREAIEGWSKPSEEPNLAWTSRLLLRELDRSPHSWFQREARPDGRGFGRGLDFDDFARRFEDLDSMFGDLRTQWESMLQQLPAPSSSVSSSAESFSLQSGPDGVTCKVTREVDGKEETREYTARTMEELLQANPELRDKLGTSGSFLWSMPSTPRSIVIPRGLRSGGPGGIQVLPRGSVGGRWTAPDRSDEASDAGSPRTDRLGIYCEPVEDEIAGELGLKPGEGLRVRSTQSGSIASILGLREGDVVLEVNERKIQGVEDVKKALVDRAGDADVSVVVVGSEGRRTLTWKPTLRKSEAPQPDSKLRKL
jgi:hypothetical protein